MHEFDTNAIVRFVLTAVLKNNDTPERELERYARL